MSHTRSNVDWDLTGQNLTWEMAQIAVLMDIRAELRRLNAIFHCQNFLEVPTILRDIRKQTKKPRRPRKARR